MTIEWNIILWCCITVSVLLVGFVLFYYILSARMMKKRRMQVLEINEGIKVGQRVMVAGIIGKITQVKDDSELIKVEIAKDTIIEVSRFAVTNLVQ